MKGKTVGIVGSGLIGRSWAMLFAAAEYDVILFDIKQSQLDEALLSIRTQLEAMEKNSLLRGKLSATSQFELIKTTSVMEEAVKDAVHVQECVPEDLSLKQKVLESICKACTSDATVICSSTSCILPSKIFTGLSRVSQCIVAHPCNPPYHCPLTEIVPHSSTDAAVIARTKQIMEEIGQCPVMLNKEIDGFGLNRIQYAIINEAWRLVEDGVMTPQDVDKIFTTGLGMRYAFMGPFETIHLNAEGTENYMERYSASIRRVSNSFGPVPSFDGKTLANVNKEIDAEVCSSSGNLEGRRQWRDERLAALSMLKKDLDAST